MKVDLYFPIREDQHSMGIVNKITKIMPNKGLVYYILYMLILVPIQHY